eukprot:3851826-Rhodomonas_salina.1
MDSLVAGGCKQLGAARLDTKIPPLLSPLTMVLRDSDSENRSVQGWCGFCQISQQPNNLYNLTSAACMGPLLQLRLPNKLSNCYI